MTTRMLAAMRGEGPTVDEREGNVHRIAGPGVLGVSVGDVSLFDEAPKKKGIPGRGRGG